MARPLKNGLDYFPMDTKLDFKLQLIQAKYKLEGLGFIDLLYRIIYQEGYFLKLDEDNLIMLSNNFGLTEQRFMELLNFCIEKEIFSKEIFDKYKVITSNGIQKRYFHKSLKRTGVKEWEFLTPETELLLSETGIIDAEKYTNKIKEKEIKLDEIKEWEGLFDFWFTYKKTKGQTYKNSVSKEALKTKLKKLSADNLETGKLIVEQSISNNWAGLFPLKNQTPQRRNTVQDFEPIKTY